MEMNYHSSGQMGINSNIYCTGAVSQIFIVQVYIVVNRGSASVLHMSRAKNEIEHRRR